MKNKKMRPIANALFFVVILLFIPSIATILWIVLGQRQSDEPEFGFTSINAGGLIFSVAFHPNDKEIMTVDDAGKITIWDVPSGEFKKAIAPTDSEYVWATYSHDGRLIAAKSKDNHLHLLHTGTDQNLVSIFRDQTARRIAFSADDRLLAFGNAESEVELYEISKRRVIGRLIGHSRGITTLAFSRDGKLLATGSVDDTVRIWDVELQNTVSILRWHGNYVSIFPICLAFSPDGKSLVTGHYDNAIRIWDVKSGQQNAELNAHNNWVHALAFRPDGKVFASAGGHGRIVLWQLANRQRLATLRKHKSTVTGLSFNSSGRYLASVSTDSRLIVWDLSAL